MVPNPWCNFFVSEM